MARRRREHLQCTECPWSGTTSHGRLRWAVFAASTLAVVILVALEFAGLTALGEGLWPIVITILVLSIGLRLLIRGDRCPRCGARAIYLKRPPDSPS